MSPSDLLLLAPGPDAVSKAIAWLEGLAERELWPARTAMGMTLSVDEALTNVVSYAFAQQPSNAPTPHIQLAYARLPDAVQITLTDNGMPFDPTTLAPPEAMTSVETASIGGHGVQLMRHYLSRLAYERTDDENRLTLEAALPAG